MSFSFTIKQAGASKLDTPALFKQFSPAFFMGTPSQFSAYIPLGAHTSPTESTLFLYGHSSPPGRGFLLHIDESRTLFTIETPLPTTSHDLEDFFAFAGMLARFLGANELQPSEGPMVSRGGAVALFSAVAVRNQNELQKLCSSENAVVSSVLFPLWLPESLRRRICSLPAQNCEIFFSNYLSDKQARSFTYIEPHFSQDEEGNVKASYFLESDMPSIIPKEAFVPYGPAPFEGAPITEWTLTLTDNGQTIGTVAYSAFLEYLDARDVTDFDDKHSILRPLSLRRLQELVNGAR